MGPWSQRLPGQHPRHCHCNGSDHRRRPRKDLRHATGAAGIAALNTEETLPGRKGENGAYYLEITPDFWSWLRASRGVDFSHSLVFVGACQTDASPYLRNASRPCLLCLESVGRQRSDAALVDYFITMLVKPTVSAEEVYYNALRVDATAHYAFKDDYILNKQLAKQAASNSEDFSAPYTPQAIQYIFDAWGNSGGQMIPYIGNGWLGEGIDEGQIGR